MRKAAFVLAALYSPAAFGQIIVASSQSGAGGTINIASVTSTSSSCRAPFGTDAFYHLDHSDRLFIVQPSLGRAAGLDEDNIAAYRTARARALERVIAARATLMASPDIDPSFKALLTRHGAPPGLKLDVPLLRAPSRPAAGAKAEPRLEALERALARVRRDIVAAGLTETVLGAVTTCVIDVSRLPVAVTSQETGETRKLEKHASAAIREMAVDQYQLVSLYELLENFGEPFSAKAPQ